MIEHIITRDEATPVVVEILAALSPHCERIEPAGSYRRQRKHIHDIEFVCIPKMVNVQVDLFGNTQVVRVPGFVDYIEYLQKVKGSAQDGKYTQRVHQSGIKIDFFTADNKNYGWIKLIRTGPWQYSKYFAGELLKKHGYYSEDGYIKRKNDKVVMHVPEEEDVYKLVNQKPILPFARL